MGYTYYSTALPENPQILQQIRHGAKMETLEARRFRNAQLQMQQKQLALQEMQVRSTVSMNEMNAEFQREQLVQNANRLNLDVKTEDRLQRGQFLQADRDMLNREKFAAEQKAQMANVLSMLSEAGATPLQEGQAARPGEVEFIAPDGQRYSVIPEGERKIRQELKLFAGKEAIKKQFETVDDGLTESAKQELKFIDNELARAQQNASKEDSQLESVRRSVWKAEQEITRARAEGISDENLKLMKKQLDEMKAVMKDQEARAEFARSRINELNERQRRVAAEGRRLQAAGGGPARPSDPVANQQYLQRLAFQQYGINPMAIQDSTSQRLYQWFLAKLQNMDSMSQNDIIQFREVRDRLRSLPIPSSGDIAFNQAVTGAIQGLRTRNNPENTAPETDYFGGENDVKFEDDPGVRKMEKKKMQDKLTKMLREQRGK